MPLLWLQWLECQANCHHHSLLTSYLWLCENAGIQVKALFELWMESSCIESEPHFVYPLRISKYCLLFLTFIIFLSKTCNFLDFISHWMSMDSVALGLNIFCSLFHGLNHERCVERFVLVHLIMIIYNNPTYGAKSNNSPKIIFSQFLCIWHAHLMSMSFPWNTSCWVIMCDFLDLKHPIFFLVQHACHECESHLLAQNYSAYIAKLKYRRTF